MSLDLNLERHNEASIEAVIYLFCQQISVRIILGCQRGSSAPAGIEQTSLSPLFLDLNLKVAFCPGGEGGHIFLGHCFPVILPGVVGASLTEIP